MLSHKASVNATCVSSCLVCRRKGGVSKDELAFNTKLTVVPSYNEKRT